MIRALILSLIMAVAAVFCAGGGGYSVSLGFHHLKEATKQANTIENQQTETNKKLAKTQDEGKKAFLAKELGQLKTSLEGKIENEKKWANITFILGGVLILLTFFPVLIGLRLGAAFIGEKHSAKLTPTTITKSTV